MKIPALGSSSILLNIELASYLAQLMNPISWRPHSLR